VTAILPKVLLVFNQHVYDDYFKPADRERLSQFATWEWLPMEGGPRFGANADPAAIAELQARVADVDALVVCHGAPRIDAAILERAPRLKIVGELEGDRFAERIDLDAAWARGVRTVDTTHGSSYPVSEWALALILIALRNAGEHFRQIIQHQAYQKPQTGWLPSRLEGKKVGLIGGGHIARRLITYLKPFECDIRVHDPYLPKVVADVMGFLLTSLDYVLAESDVVVCLAPLTPATRRMIGRRELELLRPGTVFVNVSRGAIVDPDALIARLRRGDIVAGLDVFDPEPIPADSPIKDLPNVFLSPHIAGSNRGLERFFTLMIDELDRALHGHETLHDLTPRTRADRTGATPPPDGAR
jgi:phosphoglycerate dehydrogenase-like enzyme